MDNLHPKSVSKLLLQSPRASTSSVVANVFYIILLLLFKCIYTQFFKNKFIYLFMATLGLCCCAQASSSCGERGLLFFAVHGLLIAVSSFVAEPGL